MRTIIVYGNCQAFALAVAFRSRLQSAGYVVRYANANGPSAPDPSVYVGNPRYRRLYEEWAGHRIAEADLDDCVLLFEQVGPQRFPDLARLPPGCPVVRFPSLDTNLLWPFDAIAGGEGARTGGPHPIRNRILDDCLDRGMSEDEAVRYYLERYEAYRPDMGRLAVLERRRLQARDERSDVTMADVLDGPPPPVFFAANHPGPQLLRILARRMAAAASAAVPDLADYEPDADAFREYEDALGATRRPIHPGVAAELGLGWYDPEAGFRLRDGRTMTHDAYVRDYVRQSAAVRPRPGSSERRGAAASGAWRSRIAIEGPVALSAEATGAYPDGFAAPSMVCEIEALAPVGGLELEAYYPPQHARGATVTFAAGDVGASVEVAPGSRFVLRLPVRLAAGERRRLELTCSERLNMRELGRGEDARDLGVLLRRIGATS